MNRVFDPIDIVFIVLISIYLIVLITIGLILWYQKEQRDKLKLEKMVTDREKEIAKEKVETKEVSKAKEETKEASVKKDTVKKENKVIKENKDKAKEVKNKNNSKNAKDKNNTNKKVKIPKGKGLQKDNKKALSYDEFKNKRSLRNIYGPASKESYQKYLKVVEKLGATGAEHDRAKMEVSSIYKDLGIMSTHKR